MSLNRYAKTRDSNEAEIIKALRMIGCDVVQLDKPVDLLIGYRARNFLIEVKPPGRENRADQKEQAEWRKNWRGQVMVVTSIDQAIKLVTEAYR